MEDKNGLYVLAIVGIIAVVGIIVMITSASRAGVSETELSEDTAGQAIKAARASADVKVSVMQHQFHIYGDKQYDLSTMESRKYFGLQSYVATSQKTLSTLDVQCNGYIDGKWISQYAYAYGETSGYGTYPEMVVNEFNSQGEIYDGISATCVSRFQIDGQNTPLSEIYKQFNANAVDYPTLNAGGIYKNTLTNEYLIYFDGYNYNGGICKIWYDVYNPDTNQWISWEMNLPNCPQTVTYWAPLNFNSTINSSSQIWLNIAMKSTTNEDEEMYTHGYGSYYFNSNAKQVTIQGKNLVPFSIKTQTESEKTRLMQTSNKMLQRQVSKEMGLSN